MFGISTTIWIYIAIYSIIGGWIFRWAILKDFEYNICIPIAIFGGPIAWLFVIIAFIRLSIVVYDKHIKLKKEKERYKNRYSMRG